MEAFVVLLRGVNVGGKNKLQMADFRRFLEGLGFADVATYIASGNALFRSDGSAQQVQARITRALPKSFTLDDELIKVLVLSRDQLRAVVAARPAGFGDLPDLHHSDAIFLMDLDPAEAMSVFSPREGVDEVWPGDGVIYSQRLSAQRTKSRLGKIVGTPAYSSMTIRSWNTTVKLLALLDAMGD